MAVRSLDQVFAETGYKLFAPKQAHQSRIVSAAALPAMEDCCASDEAEAADVDRAQRQRRRNGVSRSQSRRTGSLKHKLAQWCDKDSASCAMLYVDTGRGGVQLCFHGLRANSLKPPIKRKLGRLLRELTSPDEELQGLAEQQLLSMGSDEEAAGRPRGTAAQQADQLVQLRQRQHAQPPYSATLHLKRGPQWCSGSTPRRWQPTGLQCQCQRWSGGRQPSQDRVDISKCRRQPAKDISKQLKGWVTCFSTWWAPSVRSCRCYSTCCAPDPARPRGLARQQP
jgi:hypothetical protein